MDYAKLNDVLTKGSKKTLFYVAVVPVNARGHVLIAKRKSDGIWTTPCGGAEPGETPKQAAVRECFEEAGMQVKPEFLLDLGVVEAPNGKPVHCFMYPTNQSEFTTRMDPDREVDAWAWYQKEQLPHELSRQKNANRLNTINRALMKFYGLSKSLTPEQRHVAMAMWMVSPDHQHETVEDITEEKLTAILVAKLSKGRDHWVEVGTKVEMEHTDDREKARKIALDHLAEDPDYYKDWDAKEKILFQEKAPKVHKAFEESKHPRATDGKFGHGAGSGSTDKTVTPGNKLTAHLDLLRNGQVLPGVHTKSGKPIVTSMDAAKAQGYDMQDHIDAMNINYNMAQKVNGAIQKMKMAGKEVPKEALEISKFHEKKMREHMAARDRLEDQEKALKERKTKVKKSTTQMGSGLGDRDLDVGAFAQAQSKADDEWMERIHLGMDGSNFGDEPRSFQTPKGVLHLCKVDDGLYSGFFTREEQVQGGVLEDNAKVRIERQTIPELVNFMMAQEWIVDHLKAPETEEVAPAIALEMPAEAYDAARQFMLAEKLSQPAPSMDQRIRVLELVAKLIG